MNKTKQINPFIQYSFMGLAALLSTAQYFFNRSLWIDEAMLANNILERDYKTLMDPLNDLQVAPILFLWVEKFFLQLVPFPEYALRLFPLLLYLGAVIIFFYLSKSIISDKTVLLFVWTLFVFNLPLIYYASEVKQYMGDVFALLLMYSLLFKSFALNRRKTVVLSIVGAGIVFLSHVAPIILLSAGLFLSMQKKDPLDSKSLFVIGLFWGISFGLYYFYFVYNHPLRLGMEEFWRAQYGFLPAISDHNRLLMFFKLKFVMLFRTMLGMGGISKFMMAVLFAIGFFAIMKNKNVPLMVLLLLPLLMHFGLGVLEMYPFETRLLLYYVPLLILVLGVGFEFFLEKLPTGVPRLVGGYVVFLFIISTFALSFIKDFPQENSEIRPLLDYVEERFQSGEKLIVPAISIPSFQFYQQIGYAGINSDSVIFAANGLAQLQGIESLSGDFWVIASQFRVQGEQVVLDIRKLDLHVLDTYCVQDACLYKVRI